MKKTKLLLFSLVIIGALCLTGCDMIFSILMGEHECQLVEYDRVESTCSEAGAIYYTCICGEEYEEALPLKEHTPVTVPARPASCSKEGAGEGISCSVCSAVITAPEIIDKLPHTSVTDPAFDGVDGKPGKTEGAHCSVCGFVIKKQEFVFADGYSNPESYDGDYAYEYLTTLDKGDALITLYDRIDQEADYFHLSSENAPDDNIVASVVYSDLGLTVNDAVAVWVAYRIDHPLYYWISNATSHTSNYINIKVSEEYALGSVREELNSDIYEVAESWILSAGANDAYSLSLAFHDMIVDNAYYAYEDDGVTPEGERWAHNIEGVMLRGAGVCESYTKTFQLLLNYCGVENIYVKGYANEPHAWNLVEIEDGEWYWFDLTWDDTPEFMWGVIYNYFCVTDTENTGWRDGSYTVEASTFLTAHEVDHVTNTGVDFMYTLPPRAAESYDGILRDEFSESGLSYAIVGHDRVALTGIDRTGSVSVPASVDYMGTTYRVSVVGKIVDGVLKDGAISDSAVLTIALPDTVEYIFNGALAIEGIESIEIDADNEYYTYEGGILYNKDKSYIHSIVDRSITSIHIGKNLRGWSTSGAPFYNCLNLATVTLDSDNPYFALYNGILYDKQLTRIALVPRAISGRVVLADTLTELGADSANATFEYRSGITEIVIPSGITEFSETFNRCTELERIYFAGTESEWTALTGGNTFGAVITYNYKG